VGEDVGSEEEPTPQNTVLCSASEVREKPRGLRERVKAPALVQVPQA